MKKLTPKQRVERDKVLKEKSKKKYPKKEYKNKLVEIELPYKRKNIQDLFSTVGVEKKLKNKQIAARLGVSLRSYYRYRNYLRNRPVERGDVVPTTKTQKKIFAALKKFAKTEKIPVSKELSFYDLDIIKRNIRKNLNPADFVPNGGLLHFLTEFKNKSNENIQKWFTVVLPPIGDLGEFINAAISELKHFFETRLLTIYQNEFYKILKIDVSFRDDKGRYLGLSEGVHDDQGDGDQGDDDDE